MSSRERGMALAEVLVASAIAAGVIVSLLTVVATTTRAQYRAHSALDEGIIFRNIEAQLRVGIDPSLILDEYPEWRIESVPPPNEAVSQDGVPLVKAWGVIAPEGEAWPEIWVRYDED